MRLFQHPAVNLKWACRMTKGMWRFNIWMLTKKHYLYILLQNFKVGYNVRHKGKDIYFDKYRQVLWSWEPTTTLSLYYTRKIHNNMKRCTTRFLRMRFFIFRIPDWIWLSNFQPFMEHKGTLPCSQEPAMVPILAFQPTTHTTKKLLFLIFPYIITTVYGNMFLIKIVDHNEICVSQCTKIYKKLSSIYKMDKFRFEHHIKQGLYWDDVNQN
jgi:hypothetical protein